MNVKNRVYVKLIPLAVAAALLVGATPATPASTGGEELSWTLRNELLAPVRKWIEEVTKEKNEDDVPFKKVSYSRAPTKVDDSTYTVSAHVHTAQADRQLTQRHTLTLKHEGKDWQIAENEVVDEYFGLYRPTGINCRPFKTFKFDREGMKINAKNGSVCETYFQGRVTEFALHSDDLSYDYRPPAHATLVHTGHDFYAMHNRMTKDHSDQLVFDPAMLLAYCDPDTCDEILDTMFTGLTRPSAEERSSAIYSEANVAEWAKNPVEKVTKSMKDDAFAMLRDPSRPGNRFFRMLLPRNSKNITLDYGRLSASPPSGVFFQYDNWDGWEVQFGVIPERWDLPDQIVGALYGYYTEETLKNTDMYALEQRENQFTRWFEVATVNGEVDLAIDDPEKLHGDVKFGLNLKQDVQELPFYIISFSERGAGGSDRPRPIVVNSVQVNGEDVTWVQTGPISGKVILPESMPAGSQIEVRMDWESRTILKYTMSYSYMPRGGWMPFVSFGDVIDEFELTMRVPAKYQIIGLGHRAEEREEDGVRISRWKADSPCNFPTIIFGRYKSDKPRFAAQKLDGTEIPVTVHVDNASFGQWGIAPKSLRVIGEQAANSLNLYSAVSGVDYPFGELNLVNDPRGFLYGQAPSSLIYLGSGVFRGEGALAPNFVDAAGIAKFLKSVVAHEVGHQWWGNRIANANDRNYWFVESLAEYFSAIYLEQVHGWKDYEEQVDEWRRNILGSNLKASVQNASTLFSGERGGGRETDSYTAAVYNRGPYAFHILRETFKGQGPRGDEGADKRFYQFLKQFSMELAEKREIVTLDIQQAAERAFGGVGPDGEQFNVDLSWFFDQWIRGSGVPQYAIQYDVRQAEDGSWVVDGVIQQRVFLGKTDEIIEGEVYRGVIDITVEAKGGPYVVRQVINAAETPFQFKVPNRPQELVLNKGGEMLAHDTLYNKTF